MKGQGFSSRFAFALSGWRDAFLMERSFRTQVLAAVAALAATAWVGPSSLWWALILICIGLVLAAELLNSALEAALDGLHPERAEFVRLSKDCAAGAVLVFSAVSVGVFLLMLRDTGLPF